MDKRADKVSQHIRKQGLMPLFYHNELEVCLLVIDAVFAAGIQQVEYTNRGDSARTNFSQLVSIKEQRWPGLMLGAGTIKTVEEVKAFIEAGADFIVCPGMNPEVGKVAQAADVLWIPGCMTATEFMMAEQHGAQVVKLFPGNLLGPGYLKAMREIFPKLLYMPTGGVEVSEENLTAWFEAGAAVVGLGSKLISAEALFAKDYSGIQQKTKEAIEMIQKVKKRE